MVATVRAEPRSFNRIAVRTQSADLLSALTQARLVRVNRATFELEPWLAERWDSSPDGLTHTLYLREGLKWSDGTPLAAEDVAFSIEAATDGKVQRTRIGPDRRWQADCRYRRGRAHRARELCRPIGSRVADAGRVAHRAAAQVGGGLSRRASSPRRGRCRRRRPTWSGLGPFVFASYEPGQRVVLERNPHYWRKAPDGTPLPYLDRIVLEVVPDQNAELLRLQSGQSDLPQDAIRSEDYVPVRRSEEQGSLKMRGAGRVPDADALWFCLKPEAKKKDPRFAFVSRKEFRQALSHAVDREAFAQTVFLGEAVPVWGPITPGNTAWFDPNLTRYPYDVAKAKALLAVIGLADRNKNGVVEDEKGTEARFTVITQRGLGWYERGLQVISEGAKQIGVAFDVAPIENGAMIQRMQACDFDAIYMRLLADLEPAANLDFWLSSGSAHVWNREQKTPATPWEAQHRRTDDQAGGDTGSGRAPIVVQQRAAGDGGEPADAHVRGPAPVCGAHGAPARRGAVGDATAHPVECRLAERGRRAATLA